jgi:hypothetical protein
MAMLIMLTAQNKTRLGTFHFSLACYCDIMIEAEIMEPKEIVNGWATVK